ncbi:MAG: HAMP domain-containing protein [Peptococcaceae bacterium]|nr:HAMP domain-containing protein [Peptococcaceae bacterium]
MNKRSKGRSISTRICVSVFLLLTLIIISISFVNFRINEKSLAERNINKGWFLVNNINLILNNLVLTENIHQIQNYLEKAKGLEPDIKQLSFITSDGFIQANTDKNSIGRKLFIKKSSLGHVQISESVGSSKRNLNYQFVKPIVGSENTVVGYLQMNFAPVEIPLLKDSFILNTMIISFLAIVSVMLLSLSMSKSLLINPLSSLRQAAELISSGDFTHQLSSGKRDEIGSLSTTFNSMTNRLANIFTSLNTSTKEINKNADMIINKIGELKIGETEMNSVPNAPGIFFLNDRQLSELKEINKHAKKLRRLSVGLSALSSQFKV